MEICSVRAVSAIHFKASTVNAIRTVIGITLLMKSRPLTITHRAGATVALQESVLSARVGEIQKCPSSCVASERSLHNKTVSFRSEVALRTVSDHFDHTRCGDTDVAGK